MSTAVITKSLQQSVPLIN